MSWLWSLIQQDPDMAIAIAAFMCGVAALYIVSMRTLRRRKLY